MFMALATVVVLNVVTCQFYTFEEFQNLPVSAQQRGKRYQPHPWDFDELMEQQMYGRPRGYPHGGDFKAQPAQQYYQGAHPGRYSNMGDFDRQMSEEASYFREKRSQAGSTAGRGRGGAKG